MLIRVLYTVVLLLLPAVASRSAFGQLVPQKDGRLIDTTGITTNPHINSADNDPESVRTPTTDMLYIDPFRSIVAYNIGYQHVVTRHLTVGGVAFYVDHVIPQRGFGITGVSHLYFGNTPFQGPHIGLTCGYAYYIFPSTYVLPKQESGVFSIGIYGGTHTNYTRSFSMAYALGIEYSLPLKDLETDYDYQVPSVPLNYGRAAGLGGFYPIIHITLGYSW